MLAQNIVDTISTVPKTSPNPKHGTATNAKKPYGSYNKDQEHIGLQHNSTSMDKKFLSMVCAIVGIVLLVGIVFMAKGGGHYKSGKAMMIKIEGDNIYIGMPAKVAMKRYGDASKMYVKPYTTPYMKYDKRYPMHQSKAEYATMNQTP